MRRAERIAFGGILAILFLACEAEPLYLVFPDGDAPNAWPFRFAFLFSRAGRDVAGPARPVAGARIGIMGRLKKEGVRFHSLYERLDTSTPDGMFVFHVFAALASTAR